MHFLSVFVDFAQKHVFLLLTEQTLPYNPYLLLKNPILLLLFLPIFSVFLPLSLKVLPGS